MCLQIRRFWTRLACFQGKTLFRLILFLSIFNSEYVLYDFRQNTFFVSFYFSKPNFFRPYKIKISIRFGRFEAIKNEIKIHKFYSYAKKHSQFLIKIQKWRSDWWEEGCCENKPSNIQISLALFTALIVSLTHTQHSWVLTPPLPPPSPPTIYTTKHPHHSTDCLPSNQLKHRPPSHSQKFSNKNHTFKWVISILAYWHISTRLFWRE